MRSRYSAYAVDDLDHLVRTWHPRTRPQDVAVDAGLVWQRLEVLGTSEGGPEDAEGQVEFRAHFSAHGRRGVMHERSRFVRRSGRWVYLDGDDLSEPDQPG